MRVRYLLAVAFASNRHPFSVERFLLHILISPPACSLLSSQMRRSSATLPLLRLVCFCNFLRPVFVCVWVAQSGSAVCARSRVQSAVFFLTAAADVTSELTTHCVCVHFLTGYQFLAHAIRFHNLYKYFTKNEIQAINCLSIVCWISKF